MELREMDAVVAEKIMGLKILNRSYPCYREPECGSLQAAVDLDGPSEHPWSAWENHPVYGFGVDEKFPEPVPFYSTKIEDAMAVWQKIRESGKWCCLDIGSDYHYCWVIRMTKAQETFEEISGHEEYAHQPLITVDGVEGGLDRLAYAICKAALMSVGVEV